MGIKACCADSVREIKMLLNINNTRQWAIFEGLSMSHYWYAVEPTSYFLQHSVTASAMPNFPRWSNGHQVYIRDAQWLIHLGFKTIQIGHRFMSITSHKYAPLKWCSLGFRRMPSFVLLILGVNILLCVWDQGESVFRLRNFNIVGFLLFIYCATCFGTRTFFKHTYFP
jgi:hypothetical protein